MKLWWLVLVGFVFWGCSNGNTPQQDGSSNSTEAGQEMVEETSSGSDAGQDGGQPGESAQEASAPDVSGPWQVKLMTFNIRNGVANDGENHWTKRNTMVFDVIRKDSPDILGLQEAWQFQMIAITDAVPVYVCIGQSRDADTELGEWSPLCYRKDRWKPAEGEQGTFWLSDTPDTPGSKSWGNTLPRIVTWARMVEIATGRSVYVYNTHYDHKSQNSRLEASKLLVKRILARKDKTAPVVVMGDFNASETNSAIRYLKGEEVSGEKSSIPLVDTYRVLYPDAKKVGTFNSWTGRTSGSKIDYIFALPKEQGTIVKSAEIITTNVDGRYPSDHFPVSATLEFESP